MSTTFLQHFYNKNHKVQVVKGGQKSNFSRRFKLELITTNRLWFIVKVLWKILWMSTFLLIIPLVLVMINSIMIFYYFILIYKELISRKLWKYYENIVTIFCVNIIIIIIIYTPTNTVTACMYLKIKSEFKCST